MAYFPIFRRMNGIESHPVMVLEHTRARLCHSRRQRKAFNNFLSLSLSSIINVKPWKLALMTQKKRNLLSGCGSRQPAKQTETLWMSITATSLHSNTINWKNIEIAYFNSVMSTGQKAVYVQNIKANLIYSECGAGSTLLSTNHIPGTSN